MTATAEGVDLLLPPGPYTNTSTSGCEASDFAEFTPGNIAVMERGGCEFGTMALNAETAGATAVVIVNDGRCIPPNNPDSPICAINMGGGVDGHLVNIPVIMLSVNDGQPIIAALAGATTVNATMGKVRETATFDGVGWVGAQQTDPDPLNNFHSIDVVWGGIFGDGFESGDTTAWGMTSP